MLINQKKLAREELRLKRIQINEANTEYFDLCLELEDTELELDHISVNEVEGYEFLRQNEINEIYKRVKRIREREVRIQRCRWKVKSSRVKVIQRNRGYFNGIRDKVKLFIIYLLYIIICLLF